MTLLHVIGASNLRAPLALIHRVKMSKVLGQGHVWMVVLIGEYFGVKNKGSKLLGLWKDGLHVCFFGASLV